MKRLVVSVALAIGGTAHALPDPTTTETPIALDPLSAYFTELEAAKLVDVESGNLETLRKELQTAEQLLQGGNFVNAAVALYAIVKSPRYTAFADFVEYQNAEYDLAVALARAGSYGAALDAIEATLRRGPSAPYFGPAHRRAVDIALETRDHAGVLKRIEAIKTEQGALPISLAGERRYLRGRAAYDAGKLADADADLQTVSKQSRMYSSAVYLRGVIAARRSKYRASAEAMCEISATPDTDKFAFVVDDRYFTVKDLARLGLGRLAHEKAEYDDAYYHYFQIPDDSQFLPDALFEASWSMYQKRELGTSRDLVKEFLTEFPRSPLWPEASLLAGYVELADCKFDDSQRWYDTLVAKLQPIVDTMDKVRKDPELRRQLFATAITRYREVKQSGAAVGAKTTAAPAGPLDEVLALLRLDAKFIRLSDAIVGANELAASAPSTVRQWQQLGVRVNEKRVGKVSTAATTEQEQLADANAVVNDLRRLEEQIAQAKADLARGVREGTIGVDAAATERQRLDDLAGRAKNRREAATFAANRAAAAVTKDAAPGVRPLIGKDIASARRLDQKAQILAKQLAERGDALAQQMIDKLYDDTRRVLDKAKLGKIDAVIGQKRKLDIQVQDLAAGRFPEELIGKMWNASMIGDDEEYWPWQGEYWADEYEGWR